MGFFLWWRRQISFNLLLDDCYVYSQIIISVTENFWGPIQLCNFVFTILASFAFVCHTFLGLLTKFENSFRTIVLIVLASLMHTNTSFRSLSSLVLAVNSNNKKEMLPSYNNLPQLSLWACVTTAHLLYTTGYLLRVYRQRSGQELAYCDLCPGNPRRLYHSLLWRIGSLSHPSDSHQDSWTFSR